MRHCPFLVSPPQPDLWGRGKFAIRPRRSWSQERRSDSQGSFFWSSWADCMPMIHARHPVVSTFVIQQLSDGDVGYHVGALAACQQHLRREGFEVLGWRDLAAGLRPGVRQDEERTVGVPPGWQHEATQAMLTHLLESSVRPRLTPTEQALLRSQGEVRLVCVSGALAPSALASLPPSTRKCRCGRLLDVRGHHRAACRCGWSVGAARLSLGVSSCTCVPRGRGASPPMSWCGTSTFCRWTVRMGGSWRWWLMVCRSSTLLNWR